MERHRVVTIMSRIPTDCIFYIIAVMSTLRKTVDTEDCAKRRGNTVLWRLFVSDGNQTTHRDHPLVHIRKRPVDVSASFIKNAKTRSILNRFA